MSASKRWVVTLSEQESLGDLRTRLTSSGFEIDDVLDQIGVIVGRSDEECAEKVRSLQGVASVEPEQPIDIGPPGSGNSW